MYVAIAYLLSIQKQAKKGNCKISLKHTKSREIIKLSYKFSQKLKWHVSTFNTWYITWTGGKQLGEGIV